MVSIKDGVDEMKRKLIKQGNQALTISIPSRWSKRYGLKPKDEIELEESGDELIIRHNGEKEVSRIELNITGLTKAIAQRYLIAAYKKGSDEIDVYFSPEIEHLRTGERLLTINFIQELVNNFIGVEIVWQTRDFCKIKQITHIAPEDFDIVLRRVFLLTLSLAEETYELVKQKDKDWRTLLNKHDNINKFVNYAIRILNKQGFEENKSQYYYLLTELEEIADLYTYLIRECDEDIEFHKKTLEVFQEVNDSIRTFYEFFYSFRKEKALKIIRDRERIFDKIHELIRTGGVANNITLSRLFTVMVIILNLVETRVGME